jgi:hypothetical protein
MSIVVRLRTCYAKRDQKTIRAARLGENKFNVETQTAPSNNSDIGAGQPAQSKDATRQIPYSDLHSKFDAGIRSQDPVRISEHHHQF